MGGLKDDSTNKKRRRYTIPASEFGFAVTTTFGVGAPVQTELSTFGYAGLLMGAEGDMMNVLDHNLCSMLDPDESIGVSVLWTPVSAIAGTDILDWIVLYDQVDIGEAMILPATALDTVIVNQTGATTALVLHKTARGIIDPGKMDWTAKQGALSFQVELNDWGTASADEIMFLGLQLDYVPSYFGNANEDVNTLGEAVVSSS